MRILDVGPGSRKYPGSVGIDINSKERPEILHDLNSYPWPIEDSEYDIVHCSHCLEHLDNPKRALEEMYRVAKPGGRLIIALPHFSSRMAWTDIEHKQAFSTNLFRRFTGRFAEMSPDKMRFEVMKIRFRWQPEIAKETAPAWLLRILPAVNLVNDIITGLANTNVEFCERIWCYLVGGMGEVRFEAKVIK
jgi:SAM-dependent methyltransferase